MDWLNVMAWLKLIVGAALIVVAGLQWWRLREIAATSPASPWMALTLGTSILLSGVSRLTRPGALSTATDVGSLLCLVTAVVLIYRLQKRNLAK